MFDTNRVKKNTNYIFTFGHSGVGKSTLLSTISWYLLTHEQANLIPNSGRNPTGYRTLLRWIKNLNNSEFPERTRAGQIVQVEAALQSGQLLIPLTMLEMSGEDLRKIDQSSDRDDPNEVEELRDDFVKFINASDVFFLITSVQRARADDMLLFQFLNKLASSNINKPVALIITKWDTLDTDQSIAEFVETNMRLTAAQTKKGLISIEEMFAFTVGNVDREHIVDFNYEEYCEPIVYWLFNTLGRSKQNSKRF